MKRIASTAALLAVLTAFAGAASVADPLHKYGDEGAWCHVESGWLFPNSVGDFTRVLQPYNIDGNDDAGAEYKNTAESMQGTIEVAVYAADSAAADANIDGAKATAARKAGAGARIESERPFHIEAVNGLKGVKVSYAAQASDGQTHLYYFTTDRWRVKVLAQAGPANEGDRAVDAFVQALPWNALGTNPGIH